MINERITLFGATAISTALGARVLSSDLQIRPPDARMLEYAAYGFLGLAGLAVLAGVVVAVRHTMRSLSFRQSLWVGALAASYGLFSLGVGAHVSLLIGVGIVGMWITALYAQGGLR